jgi:predicted transcriptional regulator
MSKRDRLSFHSLNSTFFSHWLKQRQEKKTTKNLPIKVIITTQLFEEKQQSIIILKINKTLEKNKT